MPPERPGVEIIYDGECPFCASYVAMTRLREAAGPVRLIDARSGAPEVAEMIALGHDLDAGMIVRQGGVVFHGDAAMHRLAVLTARGGVFNALMRLLFADPRRARRLYPRLVRGRGIVLRLLGRRRIADDRRIFPESGNRP
jgi:predicted DCC family thiol-disulfide oxidoreductase YuxK